MTRGLRFLGIERLAAVFGKGDDTDAATAPYCGTDLGILVKPLFDVKKGDHGWPEAASVDRIDAGKTATFEDYRLCWPLPRPLWPQDSERDFFFARIKARQLESADLSGSGRGHDAQLSAKSIPVLPSTAFAPELARAPIWCPFSMPRRR